MTKSEIDIRSCQCWRHMNRDRASGYVLDTSIFSPEVWKAVEYVNTDNLERTKLRRDLAVGLVLHRPKRELGRANVPERLYGRTVCIGVTRVQNLEST